MIQTKLFALALGTLSLSTAASAITQTVPVAKDAFVSSYVCCVQDQNFGTEEAVSVGNFNHYRTQAWLGFDFNAIQAFGSRTSVILMIPAVTLAENAKEANLSVGLATQDWQEDVLTFNNKPGIINIANVTIKNNEPTRIDVTAAFNENFAADHKVLTVVLDTVGGGRFSIPSKESGVSELDRPQILFNEVDSF